MQKEFENKTVFVTGGAAGIGESICRLFADLGATVIITDVDDEAGQRLCDIINRSNGVARYLTLDVSVEEDWVTVFDELKLDNIKVDILVNNAAIALGGPIAELSLENWRWVMGINLDGAFLGTKQGIREMRERGGVIINIASATGAVGRPFSGAVSASKAGVRMLTKTAAIECALRNYPIRVNAVLPGAVDTDLWVGQSWRRNSGSPESAEEASRADILSETPMKRFASPQEIARAVKFLASEDSSFVTGSDLVVDGGFLAM